MAAPAAAYGEEDVDEDGYAHTTGYGGNGGYQHGSGYGRGGSNSGAIIINGQLNLGDVWTTIKDSVNDVQHDVQGAATAVGNTAMVVTMSNTIVDNDQNQIGDVGAEVEMDVWNIGGDAVFSATALCNGATISTDPDVTAVNSNQNCGAMDPLASVDVHAHDVTGGVGISTTAVANQIEIDSNADRFPVNNWQENVSGVYSNAVADVTGAGAVAIKASAVGNTAQIIHYPSDPTGGGY